MKPATASRATGIVTALAVVGLLAGCPGASGPDRPSAPVVEQQDDCEESDIAEGDFLEDCFGGGADDRKKATGKAKSPTKPARTVKPRTTRR